MNFNFRGKTYPITNPSDILLVKLEGALTNRMQSISDDEIAAYVIKSACPEIPSQYVNYSKDGFLLGMKGQEVVAFSFALTIAVLEAVPTKTKQDEQAVKARIVQLEKLLQATDQTISSEQLKAISGSIQDIEKLLKTQSPDISPATTTDAYTTVGKGEVTLLQPSSSEDEVAFLKARIAELENP